MKRLVLAALVALSFSLAPVAVAQVDIGGGPGNEVDFPDDGTRTGRTPRIPGTGRTPGTERVPGSPRTEGTPRIPGTGRIPGTPRTGGDPSQLPRTGSAVATIAMDGAALLGAGLVFVRARRRLATN